MNGPSWLVLVVVQLAVAHQQALSNEAEQDVAGLGVKGGGACSSLVDCHGGGLCEAAKCVCDDTWTGPYCEALDLLPIEADAAGWPFAKAAWAPPSLPTTVGFPWGGAMAEEPAGTFHLFFTEWLNHCPMTFDTFYTSTRIAHATAPTTLGPWTPQREAVVPPAAGNPALSRAPDGTWLLYYTNHRQPPAVVSAARNCSGPMSTWGNCSINPAVFPWNKSVTCASPGAGEPFGISLAYTKNLSHGPWRYQENVISVPASNPGGPFFLRNGTMLMPFQTWRPGHPCTTPTCISIVSAPSWDAWPYHTYPLGPSPGGNASSCIEQYNASTIDPATGKRRGGSVEDPSQIWRDHRGTLHLLMHQAHNGGRAYSTDDGNTWHYNYSAQAYSFRPKVSDGTVVDCLLTASSSRGEPRLLLDRKTGKPTALSTVCYRGDGPGRAADGQRQFWSRILLQKINHTML